MRWQVLPMLPPGATLDQAVAMAAAAMGSSVATASPLPRAAFGVPRPPRPARPPRARHSGITGETAEMQARTGAGKERTHGSRAQ